MVAITICSDSGAPKRNLLLRDKQDLHLPPWRRLFGGGGGTSSMGAKWWGKLTPRTLEALLILPDVQAEHLRLSRWCSGEDLLANAWDARGMGSVPRLERYPGVGNDKPLQHSCLEKSHGQRSLRGLAQGECKSQTQLNPHTYQAEHTSKPQF